MKLQMIKSEGLAHKSYLLLSKGEAVVVDPRRDCEIYKQLAEKECAKIKYILETHRNEDYVVGSLELQNMTDAEIAHSSALPFKYGEHNLNDGDTLNVGDLKIQVFHTPGHTDESLCYTVHQPQKTEDALLVFTGDTLFVGSVGRTDLYGKNVQAKQAEKLYISLNEKLLSLGDQTIIYPAHGAGSVCGSGISSQEISTIGYEKKTNPYLQLDKDAFIEKSVNEELLVPPYFRKMEEYNLNGPPLLAELAFPKALGLADFEEEMKEPIVTVVDTRQPYAFAGAFIPSSINIWLEGTSVYPGWLFDIKQYILFVLEHPDDIDAVTARFRRIGFDNLCGYLCSGIMEWISSGKPIDSLSTLSVSQLKTKLEKKEVSLLDVREPREWQEDGYIEEAKRVFVGNLKGKTDILSKNESVAVTCSVGNRSSIGASILKREGFKDIQNVLGGMTAWNALGYPAKKENGKSKEKK